MYHILLFSLSIYGIGCEIILFHRLGPVRNIFSMETSQQTILHLFLN